VFEEISDKVERLHTKGLILDVLEPCLKSCFLHWRFLHALDKISLGRNDNYACRGSRPPVRTVFEEISDKVERLFTEVEIPHKHREITG